MTIHIVKGDCLDVMSGIEGELADLFYLDPPFFTEKTHKLKTRDRTKEFYFDDLWGCHKKYAEFLYSRLSMCKSLLKNNGSIFVHCDSSANHIIRAVLDEIFGSDNFQSEIIWSYKRWSNSKKGLLPAHQNIYWYSKSKSFVFNTIYNEYSESTNVDQILQRRTRDKHGKAVYAKDENGNVILDDKKEGVPLSDVWEIPYLNPKARERVGYPTQKPLLLLERILEVSTKPGDFVIDPFCGSGTTLVAAKLMGRNGIGIDVSDDAVELAKKRIDSPIKSDSRLLKNGRESYLTADKRALSLLDGVELIPVHRNRGIDGILKETYEGTPILVRVQRTNEPISEAANLLSSAAKTKQARLSILVRTEKSNSLFAVEVPDGVYVVDAPALKISEYIEQLNKALQQKREIARR